MWTRDRKSSAPSPAQRIASCALAATTLMVLVAQGSALAQCPPNGTFDNEMRWRGNKVTVRYNPKLDPILETGAMPETLERIDCFQAADAWNTVIAAYGGDFEIEVVVDSTDAWAAERNVQQCTDPINAGRVDDQSYANTHSDDINAASTAKDVVVNLNKHGWVRGVELMSYAIDGRLAECMLTPDGSGAPENPPVDITEADILWFTHLHGEQQCPRIDWDYDGDMVINGFDYVSVMAHELGHLLGLDHQESQNGNNVMAPTIMPNTRNTIQQGEIDCLMTLYPPQASPIETVSWGKIKSLYD